MHYIILDLEWNQCPQGKSKEKKGLPFEIIEIGAVKLDCNRQASEQFCAKIHPAVYRTFHFRTQEVLQMDMKDFQNARSFPEVVRDFLEWCGDDAVYCTWGPLDLLELQRNLRYHGIANPFPFPLYFYDIQKIFSIVYEDSKSRRTLEYCVDFLGIPKEMVFHDAQYDACYTAEVLKKLPLEAITENFSIDYFQNPRVRKEELYVVFDGYTKFVSREFSSKTDAMLDRKVTATKCHLCHKAAKKKIRWFVTGNKNYYCLAYCEQHGWIKGKIRIKKAESGKFFCVKTLKLISEYDAEQIQEKRDKLSEKRRFHGKAPHSGEMAEQSKDCSAI